MVSFRLIILINNADFPYYLTNISINYCIVAAKRSNWLFEKKNPKMKLKFVVPKIAKNLFYIYE